MAARPLLSLDVGRWRFDGATLAGDLRLVHQHTSVGAVI